MEKSIIYSKQTIEFITIAAEFCGFLENSSKFNRSEFIERSVKILPLLYLKALLLPKDVEEVDFEQPEEAVTEEDYQFIRMNIEKILGEKDDYLEVFLSDIQYSDAPITSFISEDLSDIYQDVKNFIVVFSHQFEPSMIGSLITLNNNFKEYWSQKLVNVLRPLNSIHFLDEEEDDDYTESDNDNTSMLRFFENQKDDWDDDKFQI